MGRDGVSREAECLATLGSELYVELGAGLGAKVTRFL